MSRFVKISHVPPVRKRLGPGKKIKLKTQIPTYIDGNFFLHIETRCEEKFMVIENSSLFIKNEYRQKLF
jgi:hypothetical protein